MLSRYFDNASTTPVDPHVGESMAPFFEEACGNAHSLHNFGRRAMAAVESAREAVASLTGSEDPSQVIFTSGATEANNWVLQRGGVVVCSPFEHSSVLEAVVAAGGSVLGNDGYQVAKATMSYDLVAVMHVNNETGAILDIPDGSQSLRDLTQSLGKVALPDDWSFASCSAHKIYGPKGIGALICKDQFPEPLLYGGEHEGGHRAGTLNVPAIVGFGAAANLAMERREADHAMAAEFRSIVLDEIATLSEWSENVHSQQSPFILSLSFLGLEAQPVLEALDILGFAVSSGAACSSRSNEPSHVLRALGMPFEMARGTIRISFGRTNTRESARDLGRAIVETVQSVRNLRISL